LALVYIVTLDNFQMHTNRLTIYLTSFCLLATNAKVFAQQSAYMYDPSGNTIAMATTASFPPLIETQPQNQLFQSNAGESFAVFANGAGLSYQWLSNGMAILGATGDTFSLANASTIPPGSFSVIVSNISGSVTSAPVVIWSSNALANLIANPGFESGTNGWLFTGDSGVTASPHTGNWSAYVNIAAGTIGQTVATVPGDIYLVSFWLSANGFSSSATITASFCNTNGFAKSYGSGGFGYVQESFSVQATATNSPFIFTGVMGGGTYFLDDVSVLDVSTPPLSVVISPPEQLVGGGSNAIFSVTANGTPSPVYQWHFNGASLVSGGNILISSNGNLTVSNATPANEGLYTVTASNAYGAASSEVAVLSVSTNIVSISTNSNIPLPVALDNAYLIWTTGGSAPWFGQTQISEDGLGSARSGGIYGGQQSWLQAVATNMAGPFQLSFWWNVSSQSPDALSFSIDGTNISSISGTSGGWQQVVVTNLAAGTHTFIWTYTKQSNDNPTGIPFADSGWVDEVTLNPAGAPIITAQPVNQSVLTGSNATFSVIAVGTPPLNYQWWLNRTNLLVGLTNASLTITQTTPAMSGSAYSVVITNPLGSAVSQTALLTVYPFSYWPTSALAWYNSGYVSDGVYTIDPDGPGGQPPIKVSCLMSLAGGGWTALTAAVANSVLNTNTHTSRAYLYVQNSTSLYYRTPLSQLVWSWNTGKDLDGTYYYSSSSGEAGFQIASGSEHQLYGVGGSSGGGSSYKCLIAYTSCEDSNNAQVEICQDKPGIFGGACQCGVTVYFRENQPVTQQLGVPIVIWTNPAPIGYGTALGYSQLNASATVSGNYAYFPTIGSVLSAGTNLLSVAFTPIDTADYSNTTATVNLVVTAPALVPPAIQNVQLIGNSFMFTWNGMTNQTYQIQSTASLNPANWTNISGTITPTNSTMTVSATIGTNTQQFFRVVLLP